MTTTIKILGTGCAKCQKLYEEARKAVEQSGVQAEVVKVESLPEIMDYGVAFTPAIVIDEEVKSSGKVLSASQIAEMLKSLVR
jgi:small redox-active disulfide protein 2